MTHSRRDFLQQAATAAAMGTLIPRSSARFWTAAPNELVPEINESLLRELAQLAVDEAKRAGATFADVRVHLAHSIGMPAAAYGSGLAVLAPQWPYVGNDSRFGIRVIVDGVWGFASDSVLTREAVIQGAKTAVDAARNSRPRHRTALPLAPTKAEVGEWTMPIQIDPFTVPLMDQKEVAKEALAQLSSLPTSKVDASIGVSWRKFATVFASSEGSLLLQRRSLALPGGSVTYQADPENWKTRVSVDIRTIRQGPLGYEAYEIPSLKKGVREAAERAVELSNRLREGTSVEVGRYDLVFNAASVGGLINQTVCAALDLNRALGYHANDEGTTFAAPPADILGKLRIMSSKFTITCDRTRPGGACTTMWDEEGVRPDEYTLVKDGVVTDYHNDRQTAVEVGDWYRGRNELVRSHGCARQTGSYLPEVFTPNLSVAPGKDSITVDDLIAGTKKGFYIENAWGEPDQQLINCQFATQRGGVRKITNGKLGGFLDDFAFQFLTQTFWKSVTAIGGPASVVEKLTITNQLEGSDSSQIFPASTFRTVPMHVRDVNVLNSGRTA